MRPSKTLARSPAPPPPQGLDFFGGAPLRNEDVPRALEWEMEDEARLSRSTLPVA